MQKTPSNLAATPEQKDQPSAFIFYIAPLLITVVLLILSRKNYLLFHNLVELSSVAISVTLFSIGWNTRNITRNEPLTLLAISFLFIGGIDLLHTLSYKGMGVFPGAGVDPPTQFWIAARALESVSYLLTALLLSRRFRLNTTTAFSGYIVVTTLLVLSIWPWRIFPSCLVEGQGLTTFKVTAEYTLSAVLLLSGIIFWQSKRFMPAPLLRLLLWSIAFAIASKMTFTLYTDVYGITNVFGHILKFGSVVLVYRALALGALKDPFQTLFRDLTASHRALDEELEQRRRTEEELRQTNQDLDAFVHTASHDLRTPLTVITGSAEVLKSELAEQIDEQHLSLLDNINTQGHHMARLLTDLLSLAKIGRIDKIPEMVQLELAAAHVVGDLGPEIASAECHVTIESLPEMSAHPTLIYQLFANLIGNAIRYGANREAPITISGERINNSVHLFVADHGPGVPAEERESIFEVFYRGTSSVSESGTGIGLATAQKIAFFYKGSICVEETPGGGATFRVELKDAESSFG